MAEPPKDRQSEEEEQSEVRGLNRKSYGRPQEGGAVAAPVADTDEVQCEKDGRHEDRREDHFRELDRKEPKGSEKDGYRRRIWGRRIGVGQ